jgi:hypothetical protein
MIGVRSNSSDFNERKNNDSKKGCPVNRMYEKGPVESMKLGVITVQVREKIALVGILGGCDDFFDQHFISGGFGNGS